MKNNLFEIIKPKLEEATKFFCFKRKIIRSEIEGIIKEFSDKDVLFENQRNNLETNLQALKLDNEKKIVQLDNINHEKELLETKLSSKEEKIKNLYMEHNTILVKYNLVSNILSAKIEHNEELENCRKLINNDFIEFANEEASLAEEAKAILLMQGIEKELELMNSFPDIYYKNIIAIGGGFSSGKSTFVNNLINDKNILLPVGIKPVTAIPTYITAGESNVIKGYSKNGGSITISPELYKKFSHDFIKTFNFNLKEIMPFIAIKTRFKEFDKICFIDTPGYNPPTNELTTEDEKIATEYISQSNSLLWMIGLDANGEIQKTDLDFLESLSDDYVNKKLFIIANKAELRSHYDLENILDKMAETLDNYLINYEGISAFSSITGKEYLFNKMSLFDFLKSQNSDIDTKKNIINQIDIVFNMYKNAIQNDIKLLKNYSKIIKKIELDLLEVGILDNEKVDSSIGQLKKMINSKELEKHLETSLRIRNSIKEAINRFINHKIKITTCHN